MNHHLTNKCHKNDDGEEGDNDDDAIARCNTIYSKCIMLSSGSGCGLSCKRCLISGFFVSAVPKRGLGPLLSDRQGRPYYDNDTIIND